MSAQNTYSQNSFSQGGEDLFVSTYFGDYVGTLLDVGANDGVTFSNSKLLIDKNWSAHLVEPGDAREQLEELHRDNPNVIVHNVAIGDRQDVVTFYESGEHVPGGADRGLVSTVNVEEMKRWPGVKFTKKQVNMVPFDIFYDRIGSPKFDFISLDTEGFDMKILLQIDLTKVGCKVLCIEHNGNNKLRKLFEAYCGYYDMYLQWQSPENLIFVRHE